MGLTFRKLDLLTRHFLLFLKKDVTFIFEEFVEIDVVVSSVMDDDKFVLAAVWVQKASTTHIQLKKLIGHLKQLLTW